MDMSLRSDAPISRRDAIQAVAWLKKNFATQIAVAVEGTHYSVDHICGIACQESAYFWLRMIDEMSVEDVCARCVLDASGDAPNTTRKAFPCDTKAFRKEYGDERTDALIEEANKTRVLRGYSRKNWVYGYGLFQCDLQFVRVDPEFFFEKQWMHAWNESCASFVARGRDMATFSKQFGPTMVRDTVLRSMPKT